MQEFWSSPIMILEQLLKLPTHNFQNYKTARKSPPGNLALYITKRPFICGLNLCLVRFNRKSVVRFYSFSAYSKRNSNFSRLKVDSFLTSVRHVMWVLIKMEFVSEHQSRSYHDYEFLYCHRKRLALSEAYLLNLMSRPSLPPEKLLIESTFRIAETFQAIS